MSESSTPPGPTSTTSRDDSPMSTPAKPRPRPKPSQKAKATTKRKTGTGKKHRPLVKSKTSDEKRDKNNNPLFIHNIIRS
jgi:hypothetical protein